MMRWLLISFFCSLSVIALAAKTPSDADLQRLKSNIIEAKKRLAQSQGQSNQLQQTLRKAETELASLSRSVSALNQKTQQQQHQLKQLQREEQTLKHQKKEQESSLYEQVALSYRMGREPTIKLLLNQENPEQINRMRIYADYFNRAHVDALEAYQTILQQIENNKQAIEKQSANLLASKEQLLKQQQLLKDSYQQRRQTLANIQRDIHSDKQQIQQWQQEQKQLESLLRSVNEAIANIRLPSDAVAFKSTRGKLAWPAKGRLDARFGKTRLPGDMRWEGVALIASAGQAVNAVHHGRVVFADWFRGKGLLLIIDHGDGYMSLYAHNQSLLKEPGDWVSAGEKIATVGNSGGLEKAELYFEIRHQGKPLNPIQWLRKG